MKGHETFLIMPHTHTYTHARTLLKPLMGTPKKQKRQQKLVAQTKWCKEEEGECRVQLQVNDAGYYRQVRHPATATVASFVPAIFA